jgi:hypothetical protein
VDHARERLEIVRIESMSAIIELVAACFGASILSAWCVTQDAALHRVALSDLASRALHITLACLRQIETDGGRCEPSEHVHLGHQIEMTQNPRYPFSKSPDVGVVSTTASTAWSTGGAPVINADTTHRLHRWL